MWDHFTRLENNNKRCKCNYCSKEYACDTNSCGTSTLWKHLKYQCRKYTLEDKGQTTLSFQHSIDRKGGSNIITSLFSQTRCRGACAKMIIMDKLSFKFVEKGGFKLFCSIACSKLTLRQE